MKSRECINIYDRDCNNVDFSYNESICGFVPRLCLQMFLEQP